MYREEALIILIIIIASPLLLVLPSSAQQVSTNGISVAAPVTEPIKLCKPVLLDLSPLGLSAASVSAYLVAPNGVVGLPSIPYPAKIARYGPVTLGYLYKGKPLDKASSRDLTEINKLLRSRYGVEKLRKLLHPIQWTRDMIEYGRGSDKLLVLIPCTPERRAWVPWSLVERAATSLRALAAYNVDNYYILVAGRGDSTPALPDAAQQYIKVYKGDARAKPEKLLLEYNISMAELARLGHRIYEPVKTWRASPLASNTVHIAPSAFIIGGGSSNYIWDVVPWSSAESSPEHVLLGRLWGTKGVEVKGYQWSSSDSFRVPPYTTRYEVYLVITASKNCGAHIEVRVNGATVFNNDYWLSKGSGLVLGVVVSSPGYFDTWSQVDYSVTISSLSGSLDLLVKAVPVAKSYIGSDGLENLVYTWREYITGIKPDGDYGIVSNPPLRIGTGEYTLLLKPPLAYVEGTASLSLTIYGPSHSSALAHIVVSLDGAQLCSGSTSQKYYEGAVRQVYTCTLSGPVLNEKIINALREGRPLALKVSISSQQPEWFISYGAVLTAKSRARAFHTGDYLYLAVASYSINDNLYQAILATPAETLYYVIGPYNDPVAVADAFLRVGGTRPIIQRETDIGPLVYLVASVENRRVPTLYYGILYVAVHGLSTQADIVSQETELGTWGVAANKIGKGGIGSSTAYELASISSYLAGAVSVILSGGASTLLGAYSVIAGAPSALYKAEQLSATGKWLSNKWFRAMASWEIGAAETAKLAGVLLDANVGPQYLWQDSPIVKVSATIGLSVYSYTDSTYSIDENTVPGEILMTIMPG